MLRAGESLGVTDMDGGAVVIQLKGEVDTAIIARVDDLSNPLETKSPNIYLSNFKRGDRHYFLGLPPGAYVAVAAIKEEYAKDSLLEEGRIMGGYTALYFGADILNLTGVVLEPGHAAAMGVFWLEEDDKPEFVKSFVGNVLKKWDIAVFEKYADDIQRRFRRICDPDGHLYLSSMALLVDADVSASGKRRLLAKAKKELEKREIDYSQIPVEEKKPEEAVRRRLDEKTVEYDSYGEGLFFSACGTRRGFSKNNLDGSSALVNIETGNVGILPRISPGFGFCGRIGYKIRGIGQKGPGRFIESMSLGFSMSDHNAEWLGLPFDARTIAGDFKVDIYYAVSELQPFLSLMVQYEALRVEDGMLTAQGFEKYTMTNIVMGAGIGLAYFMTRRTMMFFAMDLQLRNYSSLGSKNQNSAELPEDMASDFGSEMRFGVEYTFWGKKSKRKRAPVPGSTDKSAPGFFL